MICKRPVQTILVRTGRFACSWTVVVEHARWNQRRPLVGGGWDFSDARKTSCVRSGLWCFQCALFSVP